MESRRSPLPRHRRPISSVVGAALQRDPASGDVFSLFDFKKSGHPSLGAPPFGSAAVLPPLSRSTPPRATLTSSALPISALGTNVRAQSADPSRLSPAPFQHPKNLQQSRKLIPPCPRLYRQDHSRGRGLTTTGQPTVSSLPQKISLLYPVHFQ